MNLKTTLLFDQDIREKILSGVDKMAKSVTTTLGPKGQNVLISSQYGAPSVVHDGVTVASNIHLADEQENQAALLIKQAAQKSNLDTGDGTTTTVLLASELTKNGIRLVTAGMNGMSIRNGMNEAVLDVVENLKLGSKKVVKSEWESIATISAQDREIGKIVAEAFDKVGKDGSIQVEEGAKDKVDIEHQAGMSFESGYASPYFSNDENMVVFNEARILVANSHCSTDADLEAIARIVKTEQRPLVIIAESYSDRVLMTLIKNRLQNGLQIVAVNPPEFGDRRTNILEDISVVSGAKLISKDLGMKISDASVDDLGLVKKVVIDKDSTMISFDSDSLGDVLKTRVKNLKKDMDKEQNDFNKEFTRKRIAKLTGGIAVIYAGGKTDVESKELRERIKDAVGATRSAIEEGIVPGGGLALYQASKSLLGKKHTQDTDYVAGYNMLLKSLSKPMEMLITNSNMSYGKIMERIDNANKDNKSTTYGFNSYTGEVEDLIKSKVLDPLKVVRVALENSSSVAGSLITTACSVVVEEKENKK